MTSNCSIEKSIDDAKRIILSRKGMDSGTSEKLGCDSNSYILPDGRMLSIPIPASESKVIYEKLAFTYSGIKFTYNDLMKQIKPKHTCRCCHLDPDLMPGLNPNAYSKDWRPILGQAGNAAKHLEKNGVQAGDIFIFFGRYRFLKWDKQSESFSLIQKRELRNLDEGRYNYYNHWDNTNSKNFYLTNQFQAIFGYLIVAEKLQLNTDSNRKEALERFPWHPHVERLRQGKETDDILYIGERDHAGTFSYSSSRILTKESSGASKWTLLPWMRNDWLASGGMTSHKCDDLQEGFFQSRYRGQEFVMNPESNPKLRAWVKQILVP